MKKIILLRGNNDEINHLVSQLYNDKKFMNRLRRYAEMKMRKRGFKNNSLNDREAEDFIQDAYLKIVEGKRYFSGTTVDELYVHYKNVISSLISNEVRKGKVKQDGKDEFGEYEKSIPKFEHIDISEKNEFENIVFTNENKLNDIIFEEDMKRIIEELIKNDDRIALSILKYRINGISNPYEIISKKYNIPIKEVYNANKRLKRIAVKVMGIRYKRAA